MLAETVMDWTQQWLQQGRSAADKVLWPAGASGARTADGFFNEKIGRLDREHPRYTQPGGCFFKIRE